MNARKLAKQIVGDGGTQREIQKVIQQIQIFRAEGLTDEEIREVLQNAMKVEERMLEEKDKQEIKGIIVDYLPEEYRRDDWR